MLVTILDHVVPPSVDLSISYPFIGALPGIVKSIIGAVQDMSILKGDDAMAERDVGARGGMQRIELTEFPDIEPLIVPLLLMTLLLVIVPVWCLWYQRSGY